MVSLLLSRKNSIAIRKLILCSLDVPCVPSTEIPPASVERRILSVRGQDEHRKCPVKTLGFYWYKSWKMTDMCSDTETSWTLSMIEKMDL